ILDLKPHSAGLKNGSTITFSYMVADLNRFCFSLGMEGGAFLMVKCRLHGTLKNFQGQYFYGEGRF
ncbi:MAG: hypothetical protein Q4C34_05125, partial [Bacteroidales bacterium]|nr:hypothetical protein [Bacteroidales bacterium]